MGRSKARFVAFAVLPATAVALGAVAGVLQWQIVSYRETASAVGDSVQAARSTAARILSYQADTVEHPGDKFVGGAQGVRPLCTAQGLPENRLVGGKPLDAEFVGEREERRRHGTFRWPHAPGALAEAAFVRVEGAADVGAGVARHTQAAVG